MFEETVKMMFEEYINEIFPKFDWITVEEYLRDMDEEYYYGMAINDFCEWMYNGNDSKFYHEIYHMFDNLWGTY